MRDLKKHARKSRYLRTVYSWMTQVADPISMMRALHNLVWYLQDWHRYAHLPGAEPIRFVDSWPQLHDRTSKTPFDAHYFWMNGWAMRRIVAQRPVQHVDIGSQTMFVNLLSAVLPVTFMDYRSLDAKITGLTNLGGDILNLPFADGSIVSLSCLHVAEHIGLGRYGDPLNPYGTRQACAELQRVLAPGGNLYFALPVGRPRVCFNGCRIHAPRVIMDYFVGLELLEFSAVYDDGRYVEHVGLDEFSSSYYACGLFWLYRVTAGT